MSTTEEASFEEENKITYGCGIDIGRQSCSGYVTRPDNSVVIKPTNFANTREGWQIWKEKLGQLDASPNQILIGMEASARYGEKLYHELEQSGYALRLLHQRKTRKVHKPEGHHAKTDRLDAMTITSVLLRGDPHIGYVPNEKVVTYWELMRLNAQLSEEAAEYQNKIRAQGAAPFPKFTQVFVDPCSPDALEVLHAYPSASEMADS